MWFRKYDLILAMPWSCHECWVSVRVRCWAMRRRREERGGADTCSETRGPRHIPPSLGRITLHTVHITHYIHYTYRSHQPGNVWIPLGAGRSWPISPAQDHHFRLTPPSLGLCIIANDSLTEIPGQCHLQPLEGYHWIMWYCALNLIPIFSQNWENKQSSPLCRGRGQGRSGNAGVSGQNFHFEVKITH